ncbi:MAG: Hsp70 family protein, partial [Myxococcales bacterium]|nr:Hsp70 family protein [Myxococcales bacterium]
AIPAEQSRVFSTAQDNQTVVRVRICQGESRRLEANQGLGEFLLVDLPRGPRGHAKVSVTFVLDANGILQVQAKDLATGRAQGIEVNLVGGLSDDEIAKLRAKQDSLFGG